MILTYMVRSIPIRSEVLAANPEPECEGCGAGVIRQKCLFELGSGCPRHEQRHGWETDLLKAELALRSSEAGDVPLVPMEAR